MKNIKIRKQKLFLGLLIVLLLIFLGGIIRGAYLVTIDSSNASKKIEEAYKETIITKEIPITIISKQKYLSENGAISKYVINYTYDNYGSSQATVTEQQYNAFESGNQILISANITNGRIETLSTFSYNFIFLNNNFKDNKNVKQDLIEEFNKKITTIDYLILHEKLSQGVSLIVFCALACAVLIYSIYNKIEDIQLIE